MAGKPGRNIKHGHTCRVDGNHHGSREYRIWCGMRRRCIDPKSTPYPIYGGRGISVCERWQESFANFLADMGPCPHGCSLDRVNPNGDYEPANCRWATKVQQAQNQRGVKLSFDIADEMRALKASGIRTVEIAKRFNVNKASVERVLNGKRWVRALSSPLTPADGSGT